MPAHGRRNSQGQTGEASCTGFSGLDGRAGLHDTRWKSLGQSHSAHPCHASALSLSLPTQAPEPWDPFQADRSSASCRVTLVAPGVPQSSGRHRVLGQCHSTSTPAVFTSITAPLPWVQEVLEDN